MITGDVSYTGNEGDAVGGDMDATDVEGLTDTTYFTISSQGANGTAAIDAETGVWTFTPGDPNWFGSDSFEVTVTDDLGGSTSQVVNITLANVDDAAVITGDVSYTGNEGDAVGGDMDATDVEGLTDTTYFTVSSQGANGTAAIDAETGVWTFTPSDSNWFGSDSFTVNVTDAWAARPRKWSTSSLPMWTMQRSLPAMSATAVARVMPWRATSTRLMWKV